MLWNQLGGLLARYTWCRRPCGYGHSWLDWGRYARVASLLYLEAGAGPWLGASVLYVASHVTGGWLGVFTARRCQGSETAQVEAARAREAQPRELHSLVCIACCWSKQVSRPVPSQGLRVPPTPAAQPGALAQYT